MYGVRPPALHLHRLVHRSNLLPYTGSGINFYLANNTDPLTTSTTSTTATTCPPTSSTSTSQTDSRARSRPSTSSPTPTTTTTPRSTPTPCPSPNTTVGYNGNPASKTWYGITVDTLQRQRSPRRASQRMPCGVDKYNSYRKYGETFKLSQVSQLRHPARRHVVRVGQHQPPPVPLRPAQRLGRPAAAQLRREVLDQLLPALRRV